MPTFERRVSYNDYETEVCTYVSVDVEFDEEFGVDVEDFIDSCSFDEQVECLERIADMHNLSRIIDEADSDAIQLLIEALELPPRPPRLAAELAPTQPIPSPTSPSDEALDELLADPNRFLGLPEETLRTLRQHLLVELKAMLSVLRPNQPIDESFLTELRSMI